MRPYSTTLKATSPSVLKKKSKRYKTSAANYFYHLIHDLFPSLGAASFKGSFSVHFINITVKCTEKQPSKEESPNSTKRLLCSCSCLQMLNRLTKSAEQQARVDEEYFSINMEGHQMRLKWENTLKNCYQVEKRVLLLQSFSRLSNRMCIFSG